MSSEVRTELFIALAELGALYPAMRLAQSACMLASFADPTGEGVLRAVQDYDLLIAARDHVGARLDRLGIRSDKLLSVSAERRLVLNALKSALDTLNQPVGSWLCEAARQAGSNVYDVEDEQLLGAVATDSPIAPAENVRASE